MAQRFRARYGTIVLVILYGIFFPHPALAGSILKASCPCGFKMESILAGGGFKNYKTTCNVPAYCAACKKMEILNWLGKDPQCKGCGGKIVFYNDPSLQKDKPDASRDMKDTKKVFSWNAYAK